MKVAAFCIVLLLLLFILPSNSFAATFFDVPVPSGPNYSVVSNSFCDGPPECANSHNDNNCGLPRCDGGVDWTKYELTCVHKELTGAYDGYYQQGEKIYSIGDKCTGNYPYLDSGSCSSPYAISRYKACCSGGVLSTNSCVPFDSDGAGDSEGRCPAGSYEVFCGFGGYPACSSSSVCGSAPVSSSAPSLNS